MPQKFIFCIFLLAIIGCSPDWQPAQQQDWLRTRGFTMVNGIQVYHRSVDALYHGVTHISCYPYRDSTPLDRTYASVLEAYLAAWIKTRISALEAEIYLDAPQPQAFHSYCFRVDLPTNLLGAWLQIEAERMNNIDFSIDLFNRIKQQQIAHYRQLQSEPNVLISAAVARYSGNTAIDPELDIGQIENMELADLRNFYQQQFHSGNAYFFVTGDIELTSYQRLLLSTFPTTTTDAVSRKPARAVINFPYKPGILQVVTPGLLAPQVIWSWPASTIAETGGFTADHAAMLIFERITFHPKDGLLSNDVILDRSEFLFIGSNYTNDFVYSQPAGGFFNILMILPTESVTSFEDLTKYTKNFEQVLAKNLLKIITDESVQTAKQQLIFELRQLDVSPVAPLLRFLPENIIAGASIAQLTNIIATINAVSTEKIWLVGQYFLRSQPLVVHVIDENNRENK